MLGKRSLVRRFGEPFVNIVPIEYFTVNYEGEIADGRTKF